MNKTFIFGLSLWMATLCLNSCSSSDPVDNGLGNTRVSEELLNQEPLWTSEDFGYLDTSDYKTEQGTTWLWHDNFGRLTSIMLYIPATMDIDVLYRSPSSVDQLNGLYYQLGNDNELRIDSSHSYEFTGDTGMTSGFERYDQYYKDVKVYGVGYTVNYYNTPMGKRLAYTIGRLLTDLSVDTTPLITADQAKRIFASRLGEDVTKDWEAELMVREFVLKKNGKDELEEHLVWHVKGSFYPEDEAKIITYLSSTQIEEPLRHVAQIDAHTGRLLVEGHSLNIGQY
jgi:hypothetical protein